MRLTLSIVAFLSRSIHPDEHHGHRGFPNARPESVGLQPALFARLLSWGVNRLAVQPKVNPVEGRGWSNPS